MILAKRRFAYLPNPKNLASERGQRGTEAGRPPGGVAGPRRHAHL